MKYTYNRLNTNQLHDELIAAGITPTSVESLDDVTIITFKDDADINAVEIIVGNHIPIINKIDVPTESERLEALEMLMVDILGGGF